MPPPANGGGVGTHPLTIPFAPSANSISHLWAARRGRFEGNPESSSIQSQGKIPPGQANRTSRSTFGTLVWAPCALRFSTKLSCRSKAKIHPSVLGVKFYYLYYNSLYYILMRHNTTPINSPSLPNACVYRAAERPHQHPVEPRGGGSGATPCWASPATFTIPPFSYRSPLLTLTACCRPSPSLPSRRLGLRIHPAPL